ncbi:MAG: V-type ATP synthase subunit F [Phycisphaerae bacterium]|nr:V-type ATP synthase subunit F [Phycisphaerae bacterium]
MEGKVAVLGDSDFVMPFSAMGVDTFAAGETGEQTVAAAEKIIAGKYTLVVVAENVARSAEEAFASVQSVPMPCVVVVPFTTEPEGFATEALGRVLKTATGISILEGN